MKRSNSQFCGRAHDPHTNLSGLEMYAGFLSRSRLGSPLCSNCQNRRRCSIFLCCLLVYPKSNLRSGQYVFDILRLSDSSKNTIMSYCVALFRYCPIAEIFPPASLCPFRNYYLGSGTLLLRALHSSRVSSRY